MATRSTVGWVERSETQQIMALPLTNLLGFISFYPTYPNAVAMRSTVGWVERSETQRIMALPITNLLGFISFYPTYPNIVAMRSTVGWVERSETQRIMALPITNLLGFISFYPTRRLFHPSGTPVLRINTTLTIIIKTRILPILHRRYQTMLYRIKMDVINMVSKIPLITNLMFPKPALPNCPFLFGNTAGVNAIVFTHLTATRKITFDQPPPGGKIGIAIRQRPDTMQMIGQYNNGINYKRMTQHHIPYRQTQQINMRMISKNRPPVVGYQSKKETPTSQPRTPISHSSPPISNRRLRTCWVSFHSTQPTLMP